MVEIQGSREIFQEYRKKLLDILDKMYSAVENNLEKTYAQNENKIVQDASAPVEVDREIGRLSREWLRQYTEASERLSNWFVRRNLSYSRTRMRRALKNAGFTIKFKTTRRTNDVLKAATIENARLISDIPEQFLSQVEGIVQRGVMDGRNLGQIKKDLNEQFGIAKRRSELIALDQTNKVTSAITRSEYLGHGLTKAIWRHNPGGSKTYRQEHVKWDGTEFDLVKGKYSKVDGEYVWPGSPVYCRCSYRPIVTATGDIDPDSVQDSAFAFGEIHGR